MSFESSTPFKVSSSFQANEEAARVMSSDFPALLLSKRFASVGGIVEVLVELSVMMVSSGASVLFGVELFIRTLLSESCVLSEPFVMAVGNPNNALVSRDRVLGALKIRGG